VRRIQTIEHVPFEGPAAIAAWAEERGYALNRTRIFKGEPLPPVAEVDLLVDLGGPMSVHDVALHPWLAQEKNYLRQAIDAGCAILGVCLGAQLLAEVLGGQVTRSPEREIGLFPVTLSPEGRANPVCAGLPERFTSFHWHGDTFSIPPGAAWLASSEACRNQAFALGSRLLGLQFHLETTQNSMELLLTHCADELEPKTPSVQTAGAMRRALAAELHTAARRTLLDTVLDNLTRESNA
jgi:GMP synthase-like glutamine amidotransferase